MTAGDDQDHRARATFNLLIERMLGLKSFPPPIEECTTACPNCGAPWTAAKSPYCSQNCREEASFIRQLRRLLTSDQAFDAEKQATQGQILWFLLGAGYPRRNALVVGRAREKLFAREEWKCQQCSGPATTFDHIGSACNRPINLRVMCDGCAKTKEFGDPRILGQASVQERLSRLAERTACPVALRPSDDPETWDWRTFLTRRSASVANLPENVQNPPVDHRA